MAWTPKLGAINRSAAELAKEVAAEFDGYVFGDIGPSGHMMEPYGPVSEEEMYEAFFRQAQALVEGGVDALIVETMTSSAELVIAVRAARKCAGDLPVLASHSFDRVKVGFRTMMGENHSDLCQECACGRSGYCRQQLWSRH